MVRVKYGRLSLAHGCPYPFSWSVVVMSRMPILQWTARTGMVIPLLCLLIRH